jgi:RNA polymerase sigma-70 factor (ECF subfamily)
MTTTGPDLIRRMAEGDREAFARFYDRHARQVYPLIVRIVRDPADAADVLQEVFWEAWRDAASYDPGRGTPEAWIFMRARTRAIDKVRAVRRRSETFVAPVDERVAAAAPDPGGDVAARAADRDLVQGALGELPEAQREVLELAYYGGMTQTEIAERLKQPLGTVKTRIRLGLERLREALKAAP